MKLQNNSMIVHVSADIKQENTALALARYFYYALGWDVRIINPSDSLLPSDIDHLIVITDNLLSDSPIIQWTYNHRIDPEKVYVAGVGQYLEIDLFNLHSSKDVIEGRHNCNSLWRERLNDRSISLRIHTFFTGHGEASLLAHLGKVQYCWSNYASMCRIEGYSASGLIEAYFNPGMEQWVAFQGRFKNYAALLWFIGWNHEIETVEHLISAMDELLALSAKIDDVLQTIDQILACLENLIEIFHSLALMSKEGANTI
jgi:hypothetical protein